MWMTSISLRPMRRTTVMRLGMGTRGMGRAQSMGLRRACPWQTEREMRDQVFHQEEQGRRYSHSKRLEHINRVPRQGRECQRGHNRSRPPGPTNPLPVLALVPPTRCSLRLSTLGRLSPRCRRPRRETFIRHTLRFPPHPSSTRTHQTFPPRPKGRDRRARPITGLHAD
jgi:hypothetical protein